MKTLLLSSLFLAATAFGSASAQQPSNYGTVGTIQITLPCSEQANRQVTRGIALIHHMTYGGARAAFAAAAEIDSDCALAYWGQAMSFIHPLWSNPPSEEKFKKGQALLVQARSSAQNDQERAFIAATEAYYSKGWNRNEKSNLAAFAQGWKEASLQFPGDSEALSFYALALVASADRGDKTYANPKEAGSLMEKLLIRIPDHPGALHYIIHAYDSPLLASKALAVARRYGNLAPAVPHALHMPSHIFTRLGKWDESNEMNGRATAASLKNPGGNKTSPQYFHALDSQVYANLQRADTVKAQELLNDMENTGPALFGLATAYAYAAVPARIALEQHQWSDAARLQPRTPGNYPWNKFPQLEAITHFARAIGAARSGDKLTASEAISKLTALYEEMNKTSPYWAKKIKIQQLSAQGWLTYSEGKQEQALGIMQEASKLEATSVKHPVTPGVVMPARELLADMLVDMGRYKQAQTEYEAVLVRSPNRFNSLYGAARSAEMAGDKNKAALYYGTVLEMAAGTIGPMRTRLQHAKKFINRTQALETN